MNPAHHRYIELYHKLQHFTPLNNLFGQKLNTGACTGFGLIHPGNYSKFLTKEQAVNTFTCLLTPFRKQMTITERKFISINIDKS